MNEKVLAPRTRARAGSWRPKHKSDTVLLGNTAAIEASLPEEPRSETGLTSREVLERTRERLREQAAQNPDSSASWWTALPSGHWHVFSFENGRVLADFVVEK